MQKNYLKKVQVSFLLDEKIASKRAKEFIKKLAEVIQMTIVWIKVVKLPPGFDILTAIKESHIYLGYWEQIDLVMLDIFSCKDFEASQIEPFIKNFFKVKGIKFELIKDTSVFTELKNICPIH